MQSFDVITIDGPSSSGKSTIGLLFSQKIGFQFIDSGSIYRAGTLAVLEKKIPLENHAKITEIFQTMDIRFQMENGKPQAYIYGKNVTSKLNIPKVTETVPAVGAIRSVREIVKNMQKGLAEKQNVVIAGRDIGSEIFPQAELKFLITASAEIRAKRRFEQLKLKNPDVFYEDVLQEIQDRDYKDATREASPFRIPEDVVIIDTSNLNIEQVVEKMMEYFLSRKNVKPDIVSSNLL